MTGDGHLIVLVVGLGSIGQRHLRNLHRLLGHGVDFWALRSRRRPGVITEGGALTTGTNVEERYGIRVFTEMEEAMDAGPDVVFVTNPTSLHMPVALAAARAGCHLFIEKPISHTLEGVEELQRIVEAKDLTVAVGFQFRCHPGLRGIKRLLDEGAVGASISAQAHWGEYLPDWHPWEDHREGYSARAELGGGVILTLCHPFDYLRWLLGEVAEVSAMVSERGLDIPVEDTADVSLRFQSGVLGHVHLDYVQRPPGHWLQIACERGTLRWDNADGVARCHSVETDGWRSFARPEGFERNTLFVDEVRQFLACLAGSEEPRCTLADGVQALRIALAAKRSAAEGRRISL